MSKALSDPEILSIAAGFVDTPTLPDDLMKSALDAVFADPAKARVALQYGATAGHRGLREALAARLMAQGLPNVDPARLCISNGGQQSLYTVTNIMVDPGDVVLVEDPTYFVYMDVLTAAGAHVIGVTTDHEGMVPEALEARLRELHERGLRDRLKILYVMSYYSNPKGCNLSRRRREELYAVYRREAERSGEFLFIEDASYRDLCLEGQDEPFIKSWDAANEHIFLCGTFSKAFAPGVRLGWSYMPAEVHEALIRQKGNQDFGSSNLNQSVMAELLTNGAYDQAADRFRTRYRQKRDTMLAALAEFWPAETSILKPDGGLYVWASLPGIETEPGSPFFEEVLRHKVLYVPGRYCFCDETQEPRPRNAMRLCYGIAGTEEIREAIRRMGLAAEACR
jgi:2-aminoadipate transaminase